MKTWPKRWIGSKSRECILTDASVSGPYLPHRVVVESTRQIPSKAELMDSENRFSENDVCRIAAEAWESVAGTKLRVSSGGTERIAQGDIMTACVTLNGKWSGGVIIMCPVGLVRRAAAAILDAQESEIGFDDVRDLLGEITNTVAGNLTQWLPVPTNLSLPVIADCADISMGIPQGRIVYRTALDCESDPVLVLVLESERIGIKHEKLTASRNAVSSPSQ